MNFTRPSVAFFFAIFTVSIFYSCSEASACVCKANDLKSEAANIEMKEKCKETENNMSAEQKAEFIASYMNCK